MALAGNTKELIQKGERASRTRLIFINIVVLLLALSINTQSSVHEELDSLMLRGFFKTRSMLGRDVGLDPRLFIFNLDDKTTNLIGMPDFGFAGWTYVLETLLERKPKAVVIDKVFSLNLAKANIDKLQAVLRKYDTPVYVGAFFTSSELLEREAWSKSPSVGTAYDLASLSRVKKNFAYGPHKDLREYFRDITNYLI
ncbi:MAG: hypothetical protein EOP10_23315 [Proteobacteria bacterium]|nr:MAG: hypothetical protein EOP10_23315 [Pseudomonadota bacterium]